MYVVMRAQGGDPRAMAGVVREQLGEIDPTLPVADVRLMEDVLLRAQARPRFLTLLLSLFSGVALAIATVGIYGVVSYSVTLRHREIGIRMALGAQQASVLLLVVRQGLQLALIGVAIGTGGALLLSRLLAGLLFGISPSDPLTFASIAALLAATATAASFVPARRAARIDPMRAFRTG